MAAIPPEHRERCLIVGSYGGGNYGDELLLELTQRHLHRAGVRRASFIYQAPARYAARHRDFGYRLVDTGRTLAVLRAVVQARAIVVGGGGLWGRDATRSTLVLSLGLLMARWLLGTPVYLLGVGYYRSASRWARAGARLAAWASTAILARDQETYANFRRITRRMRRDRDLIFHVDDADLDAYQSEAELIGARLAGGAGPGRAVFVGLRRFRDELGRAYQNSIERLIGAHPDRLFLLATLEPPDIDDVQYAWAMELARRCSNVRVLDIDHNPLALLAWLRRERDRLIMLAPQYHAIASAHLAGIPLFPMAYDNKVEQLLTECGYDRVESFYTVPYAELDAFVASTWSPGAPITEPIATS